MSLSDIIKSIEAASAAAIASVDIPTLLKVAASAEAALPAIEQGIASAEPYVQAFVKVMQGQTLTADDWTAMDARLDAGSAALQAAANTPDPA